MYTIKMGANVQDKITGFEGIVTGACSYISGCDQYLVQPKVDEKGSPRDGKWFDDQRLTVLDGDPVTLDNSNGNGPDMVAPVK